MYGPAQKQPLRAWMPNRSLRTATTKLACSRPARVPQAERDDRQPLGVGIAEDLDLRVRGPRAQRAAREVVLAAADLVGCRRPPSARTRGRRGPTRRSRASRPPRGSRGRGGRSVPVGADEQDGAAARDRRHAVAQQRALGHEDSGRPRSADELVRRDEHRVLDASGPLDVRSRVHVDRQVRAGRGVVPARLARRSDAADRDLVDVGHDAGHVRRGGEAAELHRPVGVAAQLVARGARGRRGRARPRRW